MRTRPFRAMHKEGRFYPGERSCSDCEFFHSDSMIPRVCVKHPEEIMTQGSPMRERETRGYVLAERCVDFRVSSDVGKLLYIKYVVNQETRVTNSAYLDLPWEVPGKVWQVVFLRDPVKDEVAQVMGMPMSEDPTPIWKLWYNRGWRNLAEMADLCL